MNNIQLLRNVNNARRDIDYVIDELIFEIEQLEQIIESKDKEIEELNDKINDLEL